MPFIKEKIPVLHSFSEEVVETKKCRKCSASFEITDKDLEFYDKVSPVYRGKKYNIPSTKYCPDCRSKKMLYIRNERNLYKRKCDATGKDIITIHRPGNHVVVYDQKYWWGNEWNALDYGIEFNFSKTFFEQFERLYKKVPQISLNSPMSERSEFTNQCEGNKDCYMMFCTGDSENCYYGMWNQDSKYCMDCLYVELCEYCYEVLNAKNSYKCYFSENIENCSELYFSKDCTNCKNCIGCVNLENKQYHIFNKAYTKEDYYSELKNLDIFSSKTIKELQNNFSIFKKGSPVKYYNGKNNENFNGNYIENSKEALNVYNCRDNEETKNCRDSWRIKKCFDLIETIEIENSYMMEGSAFVNKSLFGLKLHTCNYIYYSSHCNSSNNLFGCIGLKNKSYCILNKQYTKEEYKILVPKIIDHMKTTGEWGEFFPSSISPFSYNETVAQEYSPLEKKKLYLGDLTGQTMNHQLLM